MRCLIIILILAYVCAHNEVTILVVGNAGVGKSTLINNMIGRQAASVCSDQTCTRTVQKYNIDKYGYTYAFYDTQGFNDSQGSNDVDIISEIRQNINKINIILLCYDLSAPRMYRDDNYKNIQIKLGNGIEGYTVVVYTKSNLLFEDDRQQRAEKWNNVMHPELNYYIAEDTASVGLWINIISSGRRNGLDFSNNVCDNAGSLTENIRDSSGCFDANDLVSVKSNNSHIVKQVRDIQAGDYIIGQKGYTLVHYVYQHIAPKSMIRIINKFNYVSMTPNHVAVYERNGEIIYDTADTVIIGDTMIGENGNRYNVTNLEHYIGEAKYILTDDNHINVNGILASTHVDNHSTGSWLTAPLKYLLSYGLINSGVVDLLKNIYTYIN
jgi:small GTP-binding protein